MWKLTSPDIVKCDKCGEYKLLHRMCRSCGYYRGREVMKMEA